jgi:hypothetical protein
MGDVGHYIEEFDGYGDGLRCKDWNGRRRMNIESG